ncbi:MAG: hypothetical protein AAF658_14555, partial [Myxococcota bacterium]
RDGVMRRHDRRSGDESRGASPMRACVLLLVMLMGCAADERLGIELESFCSLVTEAQALHPRDRSARSKYVAERSDASLSSQAFVDVMRALAVASSEERPNVLRSAGKRGGLSEFECPAILGLYQK